jgi:hypothetical protein
MYKFVFTNYSIIKSMENQEREAAILQINNGKAYFRSAQTK